MKLQIETMTALLMLAVILLAGCSGCGQEIAPEHADPFNQAAYGPVAANSQKKLKLPPFSDPSIDKLIEQFKVDVAENRGDTDVLKRKKQAVANPELLWRYKFAVPKQSFRHPDLSIVEYNLTREEVRILRHDQRGKSLRSTPIGVPGIPDGTEFKFMGEVYYTTQEQEARIDAVPTTLSKKERKQKEYEILFEGIDAYTAAKYFMDTEEMRETFGLHYAQRAIENRPKSVAAMDVWVRSHPKDQQIEAYKQLLKKFPNAAFAHADIARQYLYDQNDAAIALHHIQIACQLDSRIAKENSLLAKCYAKLGKWKQSIAAYQGLSWIQKDVQSPSLDGLEKVHDEIHKQHYGHYIHSDPPRYVFDEKTRKFVIDKSEESKE